MAKKKPPRPSSTIAASQVPEVGPREPCPCGSGKRYRVCHGRSAVLSQRQFVARPFEGLPGESDWIAMKEMVPAATAELELTQQYQDADGRRVTLATVLPGAVPAIIRADGRILVGMQTPAGSGDASRDLADVILRALQAEPGTQITLTGIAGPGPRLQDILGTEQPLDLRVHANFDYWLEGAGELPEEVRAAMEKANASIVPTVRLAGVDAAYWVRIGSKEHLRWVLPFEEDAVLDAFARLHVAGTDGVAPGSRFIGSFRAYGLIVPVWDLAPGTEADAMEAPALAYYERFSAAMAVTEPLDAAARHARAGLLNRQLTLR